MRRTIWMTPLQAREAMTTLLADTSFFVAYLNPREDCHAQAVEWMTASSDRIVTTEWVLAELGNFLAEGPNRRLFASLRLSRCRRRIVWKSCRPIMHLSPMR